MNHLKKAVVTGASSGIGKEIVQKLLSLNYFVIGVSKTIAPNHFNHPSFKAIQTNLLDDKELTQLCKTLKSEDISILINCAGFGHFAPHEELSSKTIQDMITLNLTAPILLTNTLLRDMKKNEGYLINITSIEAIKTSKFSALYSATKSGLKAFGDCLFEECRASNLSVTNINPDMTQTPFYDDLRFTTSEDENKTLLATDIADGVEHILTMRKGAVVSDYTIRSQSFGIIKKPKR